MAIIYPIYPMLSMTNGNTIHSSNNDNNKKTLRKGWCFTLNNPTEEKISQLSNGLQKYCKRFLFQEETGENGTPHLQGCFNLVNKKQMSWLKNNLCYEAHYEPMRNETASYEYCSKEETRTGRIFRNKQILKCANFGSFLLSSYIDNYKEVFEKNATMFSKIEPLCGRKILKWWFKPEYFCEYGDDEEWTLYY